MRVLIVTCSHAGDDARIVHRQARLLLSENHEVTLISPPPGDSTADPEGLRRLAVPRARNRKRIRSWIECRRAVASEARHHDILLVHDPELLPVLFKSRGTIPVVWDVHEDFISSVSDRTWVPAFLRIPVRIFIFLLQRWARGNVHLILAEHAYLNSFPHGKVVPNSPWLIDSQNLNVETAPRVVYVGRLSRNRGLYDLIALGKELQGQIEVELIGDVDADVHDNLVAAVKSGYVSWSGGLPNPEAMLAIRGALAGLALLHNHPNYTQSVPTKILEYWSQGLPVVTTPLPIPVSLIESVGGGEIVRFGNVSECAMILRRWKHDPTTRDHEAKSGYQYVSKHANWQTDGRMFVEFLESLT